MPQVSKTSKTKTTAKTRAADSWLDSEKATPTKAKAKPAAKKAVAKKAAPAKKRVARKAPVKAVRKAPAKKVVARKTRKPRQPKAAVVVKPIRTKLGRTELLAHLCEASGQDKAAVKSVLEALKVTMQGSLAPRGAGEFVMPGLFKVVTKKIAARKVAAIKKGTEVRNPRTGETYAHEGRKAYTKPATVKVRVRPMAGLKNAALA